MPNVFVCCTYKTDGNVINIDGNMINIDGSETGVSAQSPIGHRKTISSWGSTLKPTFRISHVSK